MRTLIVLNIILIILVIFLSLCFLYSIKNKKVDDKKMCINCDDKDDESDDIIEDSKYKQIKTERVFVGKFITDEEYQQMPKTNRTGISNLIEDVNREYEHLKELNK